MNNTRKIITSTAVLIVITFIVIGAKTFNTHSVASTATAATAPSTPDASSLAPATNGTYKDGLYMATGSYNSPGGKQSIAVNLTIKDGVVTDSSVKPSAQDGVAQLYQSDFTGGYQKLVVGKKLNTIKLSRVSGSSLTSQGFNSALKQIESEAKASM